MKIATTKERILQYIKNESLTKTLFFKETGIKRGFLDADKLNQAVSDDHFAKIIAAYPNINAEWLITGEGNMLKEEKEEKNVNIDQSHCRNSSNQVSLNADQQIGSNELIAQLRQEIEFLRKQNDFLLNLIKK